ncbi:J domain-containing protein [Rufibacter sp. LB8]|uniref:J domain-containing protein n=1 Tax=Rufibacter sp. LB8 TaxID=2777781 RepID=UPI00178C5B29|nr:J domain-containing protein [Rufibacter sp. LB8]
MIPNYYQRLGLTKNATKEEIKKAYRSLALKYHPDRNKNKDAHQKFIEINEAYLILYDEEARIKYNREYDFYFKPKEASESTNSNQRQQESQYNRNNQRQNENEQAFSDNDLNNWAKNARKQGQDFASMAFGEFSKQVIGFVKETGFQLGNTLMIFFAMILTMSGCGNLVAGLATNGDIGNPILGIVMLPVGIVLYRFANKNWENKKE